MSAFQQIVRANETVILTGWLGEMSTGTRRKDLIDDADLKNQATELLRLFTDASQTSSDVQSEAFSGTRMFLKEITKARMDMGFSPAETSMFVLSLKQPVFNALRDALQGKPAELIEEIWLSGTIIDKLGML